MVFGILFVGFAVFIIIQAVIRNGSSSNKSTFDRNRQNDAANMSFMVASHPDLLDPNHSNHSNHSNHHHNHHGDHSHHHSGPDSGGIAGVETADIVAVETSVGVEMLAGAVVIN